MQNYASISQKNVTNDQNVITQITQIPFFITQKFWSLCSGQLIATLTMGTARHGHTQVGRGAAQPKDWGIEFSDPSENGRTRFCRGRHLSSDILTAVDAR